MAKEKTPDDRRRPPDPPSRVQVTVTVVPTARARRLREMLARARESRSAKGPRDAAGPRGARRARSATGVLAAAVALLTLAAAALLAGALHTSATGASRSTALPARGAATGAVAAAFGYPHRCLSITISPADPDYASAHVDRAGACARYRGYVNASFHRVDGVWRLVLDEGQLFVPNSRLTPRTAAPTAARPPSDFPAGCVSIAIALHDPRFARADFDRTLTCGRSAR